MSDDVVGGYTREQYALALLAYAESRKNLKPGDRVGDRCVVVPVELVKAANQLVNNDGWGRNPYMDEQVYTDGYALQETLAALDTGET